MSRWFRMLGRLFPPGDRSGRVPEMLDALELNQGSGVARESASLLWAAAVSWRRHSRTIEAIWQAAWAGAVVWCGVLIAVGPVGRLGSVIQRGGMSVANGYSAGISLYILAACCLAASLLVLLSRRRSLLVLGMAVFAPIGLLAAAATNRVGQFQLLQSLLYEARWLGLILVAVIVAKPAISSRWPVIVALAPSAVLLPGIALASPLNDYQSFGVRNYGWAIRNVTVLEGRLPHESNLFQAFTLLVVVGLFLAPFFMPAAAAFFTVPMCSVLLAPQSRADIQGLIAVVLAMVAYLGAVALWQQRQRLVVSVERPGARGNRFAVSVTWLPKHSSARSRSE